MAAIYILIFYVILLSVLFITRGRAKTERPNIVFIVADDLGWDDVSFHGSEESLTPNIDVLAYSGIVLERHYSHCVCTPSRTALLTGKFAHTLGMHGYPLTNGEDRGLPIGEKLLPEYLKELGYATHLVGKWHVGQSRTGYLPTSRGFNSHFGHRGGFVDYYEYISEETWTSGKVTGFDLYRNLTPAWDVKGYLTDVYTEEAKRIIREHEQRNPLFLMVSHVAPHSANEGAQLQADPETVRAMRHVENPERRIFAAMMKKLDDGVGEIVKTLSKAGMIENTVIVFISDNGGMPLGLSVNYASNWPLRGSKFTPYEGGIRTTALLWSPILQDSKRRWSGYMHIVDWLPTLLGALKVEPPPGIDGLNLWNEILAGGPSRRLEFFEMFTYGAASFMSVISGDFKLILGNVTQEYSDHFGSDRRGIIGTGPSYDNLVTQSDVYAVVKELAQKNETALNIDINLKRDLKIKCDLNVNKEDMCYAGSPLGTFCLYNITQDPCEERDLSKLYPEVAKKLAARSQKEMARIVQRPYPVFRDPRALPRLHNYTWAVWAEGKSHHKLQLPKLEESSC